MSEDIRAGLDKLANLPVEFKHKMLAELGGFEVEHLNYGDWPDPSDDAGDQEENK